MRRPARPGTSLQLLDPVDPGEAPAWARGTPVGIAYAALLRAAMRGAGLLDADDHDLVEQTLQGHTDHCLVHLVAYGAFVAVDRTESAICAQIAQEAM
ncbi:hypothetical protein AQJ67_04190 [Streptomyces caeruleatus]|uniref:Uncharacterized protein n=1 Tax=Streptomyces caeruleatus TaxID=661399 RepID=A0A101U8F4_9ACTN|nr:hypothetical protein AQJ67_04190 [Streptomyces caeruleatus]